MRYTILATLVSTTVAGIFSFTWCADANASDSLALNIEEGRLVIEMDGLSLEARQHLRSLDLTQESWRDAVVVTLVNTQAPPDHVAAVAGTFRVDSDATIRFHPEQPLLSGHEYRVTVLAKKIGISYPPYDATIKVPNDSSGRQNVVYHIYPTADVLPANLLKLYIHFSAPMSRGYGHDYIHLYDAQGVEVDAPFPEIDVELWDARQERLTVLFDPGRIKRGIKINEEMGLPMLPGNTYRLVIDRAWPDAEGRPLARDYSKTFRVIEPDYAVSDVSKWKIDAPDSDTRAPVTIAFDEALDHALLEDFLWIVDSNGTEVEGTIRVLADERRWAFHPASDWTAGEYTLKVDPLLEDLAGNHLNRPFERDLKADEETLSDDPLEIPITIQNRANTAQD